jgi:hypothetical protein
MGNWRVAQSIKKYLQRTGREGWRTVRGIRSIRRFLCMLRRVQVARRALNTVARSTTAAPSGGVLSGVCLISADAQTLFWETL